MRVAAPAPPLPGRAGRSPVPARRRVDVGARTAASTHRCGRPVRRSTCGARRRRLDGRRDAVVESSVSGRLCAVGWHGCVEVVDEPAEVVAARFEAVVPVEAGAAGRQQRRRRRDGQLSPATSTASAIDAARRSARRSRPAPERRRRPRRRRPRRSPRRRVRGRASAAIGDRSRPLFRPPAISTTWSKARIATEAACGVVALESLNQAHAVGLADELDAVRRPAERRRAPWRTASAPARPGLDAPAPRRRGALVTSWGSARRIARTSAIGPPGPVSTADRRRAGRRGSRRRSRRTSRGGPGARRGAHHDRVVGEADRHVGRRAGWRRCGPWRAS